MAYWLVVERLENWERDSRGGFATHGVAESKATMARRLKPGDQLLVYVSSGVSAFADVREVGSSELMRTAGRDEYARKFPLSISTIPLLTLPREKWVKAVSILDQISAIKADSAWNWQVMFRATLVPLRDDDARRIIAAMRRAAPAGAKTEAP
jgi:EVE domain-containing protein